MSDGLDNVSCSCLAFCADHGSALADAAEGFAKVAAAADKGDGEGVFLDVVGVVGGCEDFGFVDIINSNGFEDLRIQDQYILVGRRAIGVIPGIQQSVQFEPWP